MPYSLSDKIVIAVASSALFDLSESDQVFRTKKLAEYRQYQRDHENCTLAQGTAFALIRRLLALNEFSDNGDHPVEVVLLSKNDPNTGLRVFKSIETHELEITRAAFVNGGDPTRYMQAFRASLFLSANAEDVRRAIANGLPAGQVYPTEFADDADDSELRIAFDFDGVMVDDEAEREYQRGSLEGFFKHEIALAHTPHGPGPLQKFCESMFGLREKDRQRQEDDSTYRPRMRIAIITSRNAPGHTRVVTTLRDRNMIVDEALFLGGIDKSEFVREFKPHMFFDDQRQHLEGAAGAFPCAHVPFGVVNEPSNVAVDESAQDSTDSSEE